MQDVLEFLAGSTNTHESDRQRLQAYINGKTHVRVKTSDHEKYGDLGEPDPESDEHVLVHRDHIHRLHSKDSLGNHSGGLMDENTKLSQLMIEVASLRKKLAEVERKSAHDAGTANT